MNTREHIVSLMRKASEFRTPSHRRACIKCAFRLFESVHTQTVHRAEARLMSLNQGNVSSPAMKKTIIHNYHASLDW